MFEATFSPNEVPYAQSHAELWVVGLSIPRAILQQDWQALVSVQTVQHCAHHQLATEAFL